MRKLTILFIAALLHGCATTSSTVLEQVNTDKIYNVVFEGEPDLSGGQVMASEIEIGEILTSKQSNDGVNVTKISIQSDYDNLMKTNTVFYASNGMLVHDVAGDHSEALDEGAKIMGFTSKAKLVWHKTKVKVQDVTAATKQKAQELYKRAAGS